VEQNLPGGSGTSTEPSSSIPSRFSADVFKITEEVYGSETRVVLEALMRPVGTYYVRCNTLKVSTNDLRNMLEDQGLKLHQHPTLPEAIGLKVEGPFDIPSTSQRIVVDKHTAESVLQGANVYAPGILDCDSLKVGDHVAIVSELGDALATGTATMSANDVLTFRKGLAVQVNHRRFKAPQVRDLREFSDGLLYPQSLAAMVTARVLDPQEGDTVVDMNCAPGGKLSHLSQLMNNSGKVFGFDRNHDKIQQARETVARLGCTNVTLSIHDSRYIHDDMPDLKANRVLIDPPCSALGLKPKIYDFTTTERVNNLANYQKQFLTAGSKVARPGGIIVYSVCTYTAQECEEVVEFAERECGLNVIEQNLLLGSKGLARFGPSSLRCQRFHPHVHEIGYFVAKFQR
jgi:predicted RNA-binding protein (TIGR00451 family)